jgi:hypothetical protein
VANLIKLAVPKLESSRSIDVYVSPEAPGHLLDYTISPEAATLLVVRMRQAVSFRSGKKIGRPDLLERPKLQQLQFTAVA